MLPWGLYVKKGECWLPEALESFPKVWIKGRGKWLAACEGAPGGSTFCLKFLFLTLWSFCWRAHVLSSCWIFKHSRWSLKRKKTFQGLDICSTLHNWGIDKWGDRMFYFKDVKGLNKEAPLEAFKLSYGFLIFVHLFDTQFLSTWSMPDSVLYTHRRNLYLQNAWNNSLSPFVHTESEA